MDILVDLSYISSPVKMHESVALYAFRFLEQLPFDNRKDFTLLVIKSMRKRIEDVIGDGYNIIYFEDISNWLLKFPYIKGYLRTHNWRKQIRKLDYDVIYLPFSWSGNSGRVRMRKVITIHDLRPIRKNYEKGNYRSLLKILGIECLSKKIKRIFFKKHITNADKIIAISNFVKEDIVNEWPLSKEKVVTIYNSVSEISDDAIPVSELYDTKYILYVNTLSKYKNAITLVRAFAEISKKEAYSNYRLVLVGKETPYWCDEIVPEINHLGIADKITHITYAKYGELVWLYKNASLFVTPSIHEGFGYTPIEAAIYGCPVISSMCDSLPDVTAGKVFYYDPPTSYVALANKIQYVIDCYPSKGELSEVSNFCKERYSPQRQIEQIIDTFSDGSL